MPADIKSETETWPDVEFYFACRARHCHRMERPDKMSV